MFARVSTDWEMIRVFFIFTRNIQFTEIAHDENNISVTAVFHIAVRYVNYFAEIAEHSNGVSVTAGIFRILKLRYSNTATNTRSNYLTCSVGKEYEPFSN